MEQVTSVEFSVVVPAVLAGEPIVAVLPNPVASASPRVQMGIVSLRVQLTTAVASTFGLVRPATPGTPTTVAGKVVSSINGPYTPIGKYASAWTAAPTYDATPYYFRRVLLPGLAVGEAFEWTWPEDNPYTLAMKESAAAADLDGIILRNLGAGATGDMIVSGRWLEYGIKDGRSW